jgi:hypothetical protein
MFETELSDAQIQSLKTRFQLVTGEGEKHNGKYRMGSVYPGDYSMRKQMTTNVDNVKELLVAAGIPDTEEHILVVNTCYPEDQDIQMMDIIISAEDYQRLVPFLDTVKSKNQRLGGREY